MITLAKKDLVDITNEACKLLHGAGEKDVLAFEEIGNSVKPVLLQGNQTGGKSDLFPRGEDPSMHVYAHLAALYGGDDAF